MNTQDKIEQVLKEIHQYCAGCPASKEDTDRILVDKQQFMELLERLNTDVNEMIDQCSSTFRDSMDTQLHAKRKGEAIIEDAQGRAEDVYAASVIYTDDMIGRIRTLMEQTSNSMDDLIRDFRKQLRRQREVLQRHETELMSELSDMADTKKYLTIIEEINAEQERRQRNLKEEREAGKQFGDALRQKSVKEVVNPIVAAREAKPVDNLDIHVNKDAAYFKLKEVSKSEKGSLSEASSKSQTESAVNSELETAKTVALPGEDVLLAALLREESTMSNSVFHSQSSQAVVRSEEDYEEWQEEDYEEEEHKDIGKQAKAAANKLKDFLLGK